VETEILYDKVRNRERNMAVHLIYSGSLIQRLYRVRDKKRKIVREGKK
jgi:hypothetical protein